MKHMIYTRPLPEKQLSNFRLNKHLTELENEWQKSKQNTESKNKSKLFNELKEWEYAVDRFNAQNTNRK